MFQVSRPTPQPRRVYSEAELKAMEDRWVAKWIGIKAHCLQLKIAQHQVYEFCCQYFRNPSVGHTIVVYGENGSGKSHFAKAVSRWHEKVLFKPIIGRRDGEFRSPIRVFANWATVVDGFKPPKCDYNIVDEIAAADLAIIDDIGAEYDPSKIGVEKLYVALNEREHRYNFITTNVTPAAWDSVFDRRICSRLFRNAIHIDLSQVPDFNTIDL